MNKNNRHQGVDCLRILCMLLIVQYHIQGHGGLIASDALSASDRTLFISLQSLYQMAINTYALISGYVGYQTRHRYMSLVQLWLRTFVYSVGVTAVMWLLFPASVSRAEIGRSFFPLLNNQYWYFTAYAGCFVLAPLAKQAIAHASKREATLYLGGILLMFSVLPYILRTDPFSIARGSHCLWLLILYALGAYMRKFDPLSCLSSARLLLLFAGACVLQVSTVFLVPAVSRLLSGTAASAWYFITNDSPTTLILAVLLLSLFSRLHLPIGGVFRYLVSASFSVYLIHDHPLIRRHIIMPLGNRLAQLPSPLPILSVMFSAVCIYALCTCIDAVREQAFRLCRINALLEKVQARLFPDA